MSRKICTGKWIECTILLLSASASILTLSCLWVQALIPHVPTDTSGSQLRRKFLPTSLLPKGPSRLEKLRRLIDMKGNTSLPYEDNVWLDIVSRHPHNVSCVARGTCSYTVEKFGPPGDEIEYHEYAGLKYRDLINGGLPLTCDTITLFHVYGVTQSYLPFLPWVKYQFLTLPYSCQILLKMPKFTGKFKNKLRAGLIILDAINQGLIEPYGSGDRSGRIQAEPFGVRNIKEAGKTEKVPWLLSADFDVLVTNKKKNLSTLLSHVEKGLSLDTMIPSPKEITSRQDLSLDDVQMVVAHGYACFTTIVTVNAGIVLYRATEAMFRLLALHLFSYRAEDQSTLVHMLNSQTTWVRKETNEFCRRTSRDPIGDDAQLRQLAMETEHEDFYKKKLDIIDDFFQEELASLNVNFRETRDKSYLVAFVSPHWMNPEGCHRFTGNKHKLMSPNRFWQQGDWLVHIYGCSHPPKKWKLKFLRQGLVESSDLVSLPPYLDSFNFTDEEKFPFWS